MPWCPRWICGLYKSAIVVGKIKKTSLNKVFITTDDLPSSGLEVSGGAKLDLEDGDYGLAVVSCQNVGSPIDLSKLELIAFFSFMDPVNPQNPMPYKTALDKFNILFKNFVQKDDAGRREELSATYGEYSPGA
jgi:hypothetical protein